MPDHRLDIGVVGIGGAGLAGQHVFGVEDVQALVFHGAHVEVAGGHHHEAIQVQRQAETRLVPGDGGHQRIHGVFGFFHVARAHVDFKHMVLAGARNDALLAAHQLARHQREQVTGLAVRIHPACEMAACVARHIALLHQIAVGQQHRIADLVGAQRDAVMRHHVRAVEEVGDAPEPFGLALGEEGFVADVQAHQLGVLGRHAGGEYLQLECALVGRRQVFQHQCAAIQSKRGASTIDQHTCQIQLFAVQPQRLRRNVRIAPHPHLVQYPGFGRVEVERQVDGVDPVGRWLVVQPADDMRHGGCFTEVGHGEPPKSSLTSARGSFAHRPAHAAR